MFQFSGYREPTPMYSGWDDAVLTAPGYPIRKFPGQSVLAAIRDLSQLTTSFIACWHQGIHHARLTACPFLPNFFGSHFFLSFIPMMFLSLKLSPTMQLSKNHELLTCRQPFSLLLSRHCFRTSIGGLVGLTGLEPVTPALSRRCSNQLSYRPLKRPLQWRHQDGDTLWRQGDSNS